MTIYELCKKIDLQEKISEKVNEFSKNFDYNSVDCYLTEFKNYKNMTEALKQIQNILGDDKKHIKILSCMLKGASDAYDFYKSNSISDEIYFSTMKCFTRFIDEHYKMTGEYAFDREWWTARQVGCHLFRLGNLEYEMKYIDNKPVVSIHIPSDADFSEASCDSSFEKANKFFKKHFLKYSKCEYRCHSWLLSPVLKSMLAPDSNIIKFQKRFDIIDEDEPDTEFIEWIYNTKSTDYKTFPENTSLQRNMKKHLLSGGTISNALGVLRK